MLEVPTYVGTSDASALLTHARTTGTSGRAEQPRGLDVGTSDDCQDLRHVRARDLASGVPTYVGISDDYCPCARCRDFRLASGLPTPKVTKKIFYMSVKC